MLFCNSCGKPISPNARFCSGCGAANQGSRVDGTLNGASNLSSASAPTPSTPPLPLKTRVGILIGVAILLGIGISIIKRTETEEAKAPGTALEKTVPSVSGAPVEPQPLRNDPGKSAREDYIKKMTASFIREGVNANVFDSDGEMIVVSDVFKEKSDRDHFMRITFGPAYGKNLCAIGFRSVDLKSGALLGDEGRYSLGCPKTNGERAAGIQARAEFVNGLQKDFNADPDLQTIRVSQASDELVFTAPMYKDMSPEQMRRTFAGFTLMATSCLRIKVYTSTWRGLQLSSSIPKA